MKNLCSGFGFFCFGFGFGFGFGFEQAYSTDVRYVWEGVF